MSRMQERGIHTAQIVDALCRVPVGRYPSTAAGADLSCLQRDGAGCDCCLVQALLNVPRKGIMEKVFAPKNRK